MGGSPSWKLKLIIDFKVVRQPDEGLISTDIISLSLYLYIYVCVYTYQLKFSWLSLELNRIEGHFTLELEGERKRGD